MKPPPAPRLDERRTLEFSAELAERARAWISEWGLADGERDFGRALLNIAARFNSEVAERLDGAGEKIRRGFLDWLAVRGEAARPARMPVVFKLSDTAQEAVLASAPVRMQAVGAGTPVVFETENDVRVVPGRLEVVVGVDVKKDAYYLPPPGLNDLQPLEPLPMQWQLKSFASVRSTTLQVDPETGLIPGMVIEAGGYHYRVVQVDKDLVTIEPPLITELSPATNVSKVTEFSPFDGKTPNEQEHTLYLGDSELLNIESETTIEIVGGKALRAGITWQYWGKGDKSDEIDWQRLEFAPEQSQQRQKDALVLTKQNGAIEQREIAGRSSRWIRATSNASAHPVQTVSFDALKLRINNAQDSPCPSQATSTPGPTADAMTNSTPLVLSEPFYPLGREPRQFDAFYLGCSEVFSKKHATARVCFEMSDATCQAFAVVTGGLFANKVLAGVGKDRALHLLQLETSGVMTAFREPLRPPLQAKQEAEDTQAGRADLNLRCRPVIWNVGNDFFVAVAAGGRVWVWHEDASNRKLSGWKLHSTVPGNPSASTEPDTAAVIEDIIVLGSSPASPGAVLSSGRFWVFNSGTKNWVQPKKLPLPGTPLQDYAAIAPIRLANGNLTDSVVAVSRSGQLYRLEVDGTESPPARGITLDVVLPGSDLPMGVRPAAIEDGRLRVVGLSQGRKELVAVEYSAHAWTAAQRVSLPLESEATGAEVTSAIAFGKLHFAVGAKQTATGGGVIAWWAPTFDASDPTAAFESTLPDASGEVVGTPLVAGGYIVVPGARGDAFVAPFNPVSLTFTTKVIVEGVILQAPAPFAVNDFITVMPKHTNRGRIEWKVAKAPSERATEVIYIVDPTLGESVADNPSLIGYRHATDLPGHKTSSRRKFTPDAPDTGIVSGAVLRVVVGTRVVFCQVKSVDATTGEILVRAKTPLPSASGPLRYWKPMPRLATTPTVVPAIEYLAADPELNTSILASANLHFSAPLKPLLQQARAFGGTATHPDVVALTKRWTSPAPPLNAPTPFTIESGVLDWRHVLTDTASNPALSWEYWNGKGWWSLPVRDGTDRLASTGAVKFTVPSDIAESDWSGKSNYWIRFRLVGGDYGREEVKVISKPGASTGETEQVVKRLTESIKAPQVLALHISYSMCDELLPKFLFTDDSGTIRDQSDANRTPGARVEAFIPLSIMLGRLSNNFALSDLEEVCSPGCKCHKHQAPVAPFPTNSPPTSSLASSEVTDRVLFIGMAAAPSGAPVNVLLLVEEKDYTAFIPMRIEALVAGRFVPIVVDDATRALGESGILSMSFAIPPTPSELFGRTLNWVRLIPQSPSDEWSPTLRGAYLNGVWAIATETLTRELLGSSDGSPDLTVRVARPPVLRNTLELRVREPLGEEERKALRRTDNNIVLSDVEGLPGDWVLWKQVIDPADEPSTERVYALDESSGEIRFGNGQHGAIPPIGRDAIVAFRYCRTEPDPTGGDSVPGNSVAARTALNLVSPVETVETVIAADQAAGGAPPESDDRVLRFGFARLRHRNRAVTARDIEDLALQSSPAIAQSRALVRRGSIRLVVVMTGKNPQPSVAQIRELRRFLLNVAPASLNAPNALRIEGPRIRRLRIELVLQVQTLDHAGALAAFIKKQLASFFDTATGGAAKDGWELGINPSEDDIAFALGDAPNLESIENVTLRESVADGNEHDWPATLKANELVMLAADPIRIRFETAEVTA